MRNDLGINQRIKEYRKRFGITQTQMAEKLGIKTSTYSQLERKGVISAKDLRTISEVLQVHPLLLLYGGDFKKTDAETLIEERCQTFYNEIKERLEEEYFYNFDYLKGMSKKDRNGVKLIFHLNRRKRDAVYEYAYKIFCKKIIIPEKSGTDITP